MFICMRTTINIDDGVFKAYKLRAAENGTTLAGEVEEALRADLHRGHEAAEAKPFKFTVVDGGEPLPGVDYTSNAALEELLEEDLPLDKRR